MFADTDPEVMAVWIGLIRQKTPSEKLIMVMDLVAMGFSLSITGERELDPEASDEEIFLRAAARRLDAETMKRVYGWERERKSAASGA
jgi:hypothetical protein